MHDSARESGLLMIIENDHATLGVNRLLTGSKLPTISEFLYADTFGVGERGFYTYVN